MRVYANEFATFLVVGAINTALTYIVFLLLLGLMHYLAAFTISFVLGIATSYALNARFVFKRKHKIGTMLRFPLIYVFQYIYGSVMLSLLIGMLAMSKPLAMLVVAATSALLTFLLMRHVFQASSPRSEF